MLHNQYRFLNVKCDTIHDGFVGIQSSSNKTRMGLMDTRALDKEIITQGVEIRVCVIHA